MDIFVRNIPAEATAKQVKAYFRQPFLECNINDEYHVEKMRDKPFAVITVLHPHKAQQFLNTYGLPPNAPRHVFPLRQLRWNNRTILCCISKSASTPLSVQTLAHEAAQRAQRPNGTIVPPPAADQNSRITRFGIKAVSCGVWEYHGSQLIFTQHWSEARQGTISLGLKGAAILLGGSNSKQCRIDLEYYGCKNIVVSGNYNDPAISFTLGYPPKFYEVIPKDSNGNDDDVLASALMSLILSSTTRSINKNSVKKARLPSINSEHAKVAGTCFVYRITLAEWATLAPVRAVLDRVAKASSCITMTTATMLPPESLHNSFVRLNRDLTDADRYGLYLFTLRYHIDRLARNGVLSPLKVKQLLPKIARIHHSHGLDAALSALSRFFRAIPYAGPGVDSHELSLTTLETMLEDLASNYDHYKHNPENACDIPRWGGARADEQSLAPLPNHSDHFIRVAFQDEDDGGVRYDPRASQDLIFHKRFKEVLDKAILIAGQGYSFLGFSHSSLRAQSCWFMAPMYIDDTLRLPEHILKELGDFEVIRTPAKCAARIGQNSTDTNATIDIHRNSVYDLPLVTKNGYDFGDGVGTISKDLLRRVWRVYGTRRAIKPTALQIRFQGCKGMVSLDSTLSGQKLMLRSNMRKFETSSTEKWNLEICGAGFKPLPLILNRQLIKILEDLGVPASALHDVQKQATDKLRHVTTGNAVNAANFLEEQDSPKSTRIPTLIRLLNQIGLNYRQDSFLYRVVEMSIVTTLRDIKYRGRIPVFPGHTLYGIMDETGYLREGEVFVITESSPDGGRRVLVQNRIAVTRTPALHPGDIQLVNAVDVPANSPLKELSNVIVFSQHGERDLPSQLSGGDLDGDQFHIICHPPLIPPTTFKAAEYPRLSAVELDRPVTRKDE
ncbi:uncharacterized protein LTR77_003266 [Saxophila tyrrhenica]|uniref:RNA-dependent RNA polymerase n=1 Tax=Saxophila tyrrhenica TaxID=1690608 RepID=A0AAV9PGX2_9PEZI|nr:hypothetical protein LTR77_003266 [Saxophila tyrrhenica]